MVQMGLVPADAMNRPSPPHAGVAHLLRKPTQEQIVLLVSAVAVPIFSFLIPGFATWANFGTLTLSVAVLGILSLGMAVVVIGRGLDLSQVASMAACTGIALQLAQSGYDIWSGLAFGLAAAVLVGVANGYLIAFVEIPALFTTLASGSLVFGMVRTLILPGVIIYAPKGVPDFLWIGQGKIAGVPVPVAIFVVLALLLQIFLTRTSVGRFIYAMGDNFEAARLSGVGVRGLTILQYTISAVIAYIAGVTMASSSALVNLQIINSTLIFDVLLVVVLGGVSLVGGRGGVASVIVGTLLIGVLRDGMTLLDMDATVQNIAKGLVLLAAILLDNFLHPKDEETARQGD
jgi:ribose transport system permease protein